LLILSQGLACWGRAHFNFTRMLDHRCYSGEQILAYLNPKSAGMEEKWI